MIFEQARDALAELTDAERAQLDVIGITLDPENDTPEVLARLAEAQGVEALRFRLCTGEPNVVECTLDRFSFPRTRDPETGVIDHANVFMLIDRTGRVAYRLTLGERQKRWLVSALRLLLSEEPLD